MQLSNATALLNFQTSEALQTQNASKLHDAAQQFEALMIGEMLKTTRESGSDGWLGSGESTGDDSAMGMAESELSRALATSGGMGLSKVIEREMSQKLASQNVAALPEVLSTGSK